MSVSAKVIIVGSGFAGVGLAHRLKEAGTHDLLILERGDDVGGVWRSNTYPGCTGASAIQYVPRSPTRSRSSTSCSAPPVDHGSHQAPDHRP